MLDRHQFKYVAVDNDASAVPEQRRKGRTVYYGDATNPEFLKSCGLMEAAEVIVTIGEAKGIDEIVAQVRALREDMPVVSRARDADHARHLYAIGVTDAVPETIEASLLLSEAALIGFGVADGTGGRFHPRKARRVPARIAAGGGPRQVPRADRECYFAIVQSGRIAPETSLNAPSTSSATSSRL